MGKLKALMLIGFVAALIIQQCAAEDMPEELGPTEVIKKGYNAGIPNRNNAEIVLGMGQPTYTKWQKKQKNKNNRIRTELNLEPAWEMKEYMEENESRKFLNSLRRQDDLPPLNMERYMKQSEQLRITNRIRTELQFEPAWTLKKYMEEDRSRMVLNRFREKDGNKLPKLNMKKYMELTEDEQAEELVPAALNETIPPVNFAFEDEIEKENKPGPVGYGFGIGMATPTVIATMAEALEIIGKKQPKIEIFAICDKDCAYEFNYDVVKAKTLIDGVFSRMNEFLNEYQISVVRVGFEFWNIRNHINIGTTPDEEKEIINDIVSYKRTVVDKKVKADFVLLFSGKDVPGLNGAAYISSMCGDNAVGLVLLTDTFSSSSQVKYTAQTALHEVGHALGCNHDPDDLKEPHCVQGEHGCIMGRSQTPKQVTHPMLSDRNLMSIAASLTDKHLDCLMTDTTPLTSCGNGIIDDGEDCDCGFIECGCCDKCMFKKSSEDCSDNECTKCSGDSSECTGNPHDNLRQCDDSKGYCYEGSCESLDLSCKKYYGPSAVYNPGTTIWNVYSGKRYSQMHNAGGEKIYGPIGSIYDAMWRYTDFTPDSGDGSCGHLQCITTKRAQGMNFTWSTGELLTFKLTYDSKTRVAYYRYTKEATWGTYRYYRYFPLLASHGTPCQTADSKDGYCNPNKWKHDKYNWVTFRYSTCVPIT